MKSDREFIDGIYSKAADYKTNDEKIVNNKTFLKNVLHWLKIHRFQATFATGLAFSAILLSINHNQSIKEKVDPKVLHSSDVAMENQRGIKAGEPAVAEFYAGEPNKKTIQGTTKVYGSVITRYEKDSKEYVDLMVIKSDDETLLEQAITVYIVESLQEDVSVGEKLIAVLEKGQDTEFYILNDYKENLYRINFNEESQENTYISINGRSIGEDEINNLQ